jgi:hypothetical protein
MTAVTANTRKIKQPKRGVATYRGVRLQAIPERSHYTAEQLRSAVETALKEYVNRITLSQTD